MGNVLSLLCVLWTERAGVRVVRGADYDCQCERGTPSTTSGLGKETSAQLSCGRGFVSSPEISDLGL